MTMREFLPQYVNGVEIGLKFSMAVNMNRIPKPERMLYMKKTKNA